MYQTDKFAPDIKNKKVRFKSFWLWFEKNSKAFEKNIFQKKSLFETVLNPIDKKLQSFIPGVYSILGVNESNVIELIFTAEGDLKKIPIAKELVALAPSLKDWSFTALKPESDLLGFQIDDIHFDFETLFFLEKLPDRDSKKIDLVILHTDYNESRKEEFKSGISLALESYLGEEYYAHHIGQIKVDGVTMFSKYKVIPFQKLKPFLKWVLSELS